MLPEIWLAGRSRGWLDLKEVPYTAAQLLKR